MTNVKSFFFYIHKYYINEISRDAFFYTFLCHCPSLDPRTLPGKHLDKIAEQMRIHNINALLVIGGFEVCNSVVSQHNASDLSEFPNIFSLCTFIT